MENIFGPRDKKAQLVNPWTKFDLSGLRKSLAKSKVILIIVSIITETRIVNIGVFQSSMVRFHLACRSMNDPTWWQFKDICGLIGTRTPS